jgi:hypothetical protein
MSVHPKGGPSRTALNSLRRFLQRPAVRERCELCSAPLADQHAHLLDLTSRQLVCACDPCAILFDAQGAGKYRRAPRDIRALGNFRLSDEIWQALDLPINLAFFLHNSATGRVVAYYPSPGGATEALPPPDAWKMLVEDNPILSDLRPDVEALLVNRLSSPPAYYRVGIDKCFELVGLIRTYWRGLSGGKAVGRAIDRFFTALKERAYPAGGTAHA